MTAALYARVSTDDQNCAIQLAELRTYLKRMGWDLPKLEPPDTWKVHTFQAKLLNGKPTNICAGCHCVSEHAQHTGNFGEYVEAGVSGAKASRPELNRLKEDARLRRFDAVVVWSIDRFGRSLDNLIENIELFDQYGVRFISVTQPIDTDNRSPMGRLIMHILGAFAEFERAIIRERTSLGFKTYREKHELGEIGRARHSKSGRDLPIGRPRKIFPRDRARQMRDQGLSWRAIGKALGVPHMTVKNAMGTGR